MSKNSILKGTLILTLAGFATRIIGFFYRIYLSNILRPEDIGVYQLIFPIYGICFTLYASGIQTALSKLIAEEVGKRDCTYLRKLIKIAIAFSLAIACTLSFLLRHNARFIATNLLLESRCYESLKILSFVFPFCGVTACINGYFYGIKRAGVPALTQLFEQIIRVSSVAILAPLFALTSPNRGCELAVFGILFGEIGSNLYNIVSLLLLKPSKKLHLQGFTLRIGDKEKKKNSSYAKKLFSLALPLTSNRLLVGILSSIEAILIPTMLKQYGLSDSDALSIYGVLTGMSIPFIMFPSTITNSFAVLLLPTISEAQSAKNNTMISTTTALSIKYSLLIGILSTGIFITFGNALGHLVFNNNAAGIFLTILAWLCPFLYLTTTLGSILNGLGKPHLTLINTVIGLSIRIFFVISIVPKKGIMGYLIGMLVSQFIISSLDVLAIFRNVKLTCRLNDWIIKPAIIITFTGFFLKKLYLFLSSTVVVNKLLLLLLSCIVLVILYTAFLFITKAISVKEFKKA